MVGETRVGSLCYLQSTAWTRLDFDQVPMTRPDLPLDFRHVDTNSSVIVGGTDQGVARSTVPLADVEDF